MTRTHILSGHWIAHFSLTTPVTSDRGAQFISSIWATLVKLLGISHSHITAFHPQSNSMIECFHRSLKSALHAWLEGPNWVDELPWVLLSVRTAPKEDLAALSAELVYGAPFSLQRHLVVWICLHSRTKLAHWCQCQQQAMQCPSLLYQQHCIILNLCSFGGCPPCSIAKAL